MITITNYEVNRLIAPISQDELKLSPLRHDCGVALWTVTNTDGQYAFDELMNLTQRPQAEIEVTAEWVAWNHKQEIDADAAAAHENFKTVPNWLKTFTTAEVDDYIETNVTSLATAKTALKHLGHAIIIMRNYLKLRV